MGRINVQRNPLNAALNETVEHEGPLIEWVVERFPAGFPAKTLLTFNGAHLAIRDMDRVVGPDDEVYLLMEPGAPVAAYVASVGIGALLTQAVAGAAVSFGLSLVSNWLRGTPDADPGQGERETPSPTYSLTVPTNRARLGEAMPVVYGTVKTVPDIVAQPYRIYENALPFAEYLYMLVAIGRGDHDFNREDIYVGDSSIGSKTEPMQDSVIIDYKSFPPSRHNNDFGEIQHLCAVPNDDGEGGNDGQPNGAWLVNGASAAFFEDVETSVEIGNQELRGMVVVGNYVANRAGSSAQVFTLDIEFPQGLYERNPTTGAITGRLVEFSAYTHRIDDDGFDLPGTTTRFDFFTSLGTTSPVRQTYVIGGASLAYGRYRISARRSTANSTDGNIVDRSYWTGLHAVLHSKDEFGQTLPDYAEVYEYMHLVAIRIRASEGIPRDAATRISINVKRKLATAGGAYTNNPADVMHDMFTNPTYGAGRPESELDMVKLNALNAQWDGIADGFNAVYDRATSIWPAMQQAVRIGDAAPVIHGGVVTVSQDVAAAHQHFFTPENIVDGSVSTTYSLNDTTDYDCYEVEYLDPRTFIPQYERYPAYGVLPLQVRYFGCTNAALAAHQAEFLWFKRTFRRKRVSFKTEALGNLPLVGDKIYVEHPVVVREGGEGYIVESIAPEGQFSVVVQGIINNFIYSPIP